MRLIGAISTAVLSLIIAAPAYGQQEQHDQQEERKVKPAQDEKKAQPEKPAKQEDKNARQEQKNTQPQDKNKNQEEKSAQQQDKNNKPEQRNAQQQDRNNQQENRNAQQHSQPRQAQRGNGSRIPGDRYRANFGRDHSFRVSHNDYDRDRRFQYGGYWFSFVDVWPSNWLYTQDVFVVEIDGMYYLCNPMYPGINVALNVTL
jgi:hypothetical protein